MKWLTAALIVIATSLAVLLLIKPLARANDSNLGGTAMSTPISLPSLALQNEQGKSTTLAASDGRLRLIFYGFVRCPDVCPATLTIIKQAYAQLNAEQQKQLQIQFISVDPTFDRPDVIKEYLAKFNTDFTGLTGNPITINKAAKAMFVLNTTSKLVHNNQAHANHQQDNKSSVSAEQAAIIHGDQISVVNAKNQFVHVYNNAEIINGQFTTDLPSLLKVYGNDDES